MSISFVSTPSTLVGDSDTIELMDLNDVLGQLTSSALDAKIGIVITEASAHKVAGYAPVATNTQIAGLWHGGASAVMVETLASIAANLHAGSEKIAVGSEISVSHLQPASDGMIYAVAEAIHLGRSSATYLVTLRDQPQDGRVIASGRLTTRLLPHQNHHRQPNSRDQ